MRILPIGLCAILLCLLVGSSQARASSCYPGEGCSQYPSYPAYPSHEHGDCPLCRSWVPYWKNWRPSGCDGCEHHSYQPSGWCTDCYPRRHHYYRPQPCYDCYPRPRPQVCYDCYPRPRPRPCYDCYPHHPKPEPCYTCEEHSYHEQPYEDYEDDGYGG